MLIYLESSLVIRAIRDYFQPDIGEILIDTDEIYEQARSSWPRDAGQRVEA
jgi:ribonuclease E